MAPHMNTLLSPMSSLDGLRVLAARKHQARRCERQQQGVLRRLRQKPAQVPCTTTPDSVGSRNERQENTESLCQSGSPTARDQSG